MIRTLNEFDAEAYQDIRLNALFRNPEAFESTYEREVEFSLKYVSERIKPTEDKFVLGAFAEDGSLIGIVAFVRESGLKVKHKGNIFGMYVAPEARGCGIGKALLLELVKKARACEGLEHINLTVVSNNEAAVKLYRSVGFETYGVEHRALQCNGIYYDEDLMVLRL